MNRLGPTPWLPWILAAAAVVGAAAIGYGVVQDDWTLIVPGGIVLVLAAMVAAQRAGR